MIKTFRFLFLAAFLWLLPAQIFAQVPSEQILDFHSNIEVHEDASLTVTETITVNAMGREIRRGIYRDFPTRYKDRYGNNYVAGFQVVSVQKNGLPEPYHVENRSNGKRIYVGQADVFLSPGQYTYEITYRTTRQLGFFKDHDELYWNVTGNGWSFPIHKASASVTLPSHITPQIMETDAFTGYDGSQGKDFIKSRDFLGNPAFKTTRMLGPQQGLTIVVTWPKGLIAQPTAFERFGYLINDNKGILLAVLCVVIVLGYYLIIWFLAGRDPKKGTIIPLFHPPSDLSPGEMRYLWKLGYDNKTFTAAILDMAVKGYLQIEEKKPGLLGLLSGKTYILHKKGDEGDLPQEGKDVSWYLFGHGQTVELKQENHSVIMGAINALKKILAARMEKIYFFSNLNFFIMGLLLSLVMCFIVFGLLVSGSLGGGMAFLSWGTILFIIFLFYRLLKAPTLKGRKVMDQIEGFRMFLSVTEKERLNMLNPPEKTPELFEKYLPYALALDVEQKWAEQFNEVFARLAQSGRTYYPAWYLGHSWHRFDAGDFSSSLGSSFKNAISSSSTPPGSSSGGGGGGSSGGGGGGGGGGGW